MSTGYFWPVAAMTVFEYCWQCVYQPAGRMLERKEKTKHTVTCDWSFIMFSCNSLLRTVDLSTSACNEVHRDSKEALVLFILNQQWQMAAKIGEWLLDHCMMLCLFSLTGVSQLDFERLIPWSIQMKIGLGWIWIHTTHTSLAQRKVGFSYHSSLLRE